MVKKIESRFYSAAQLHLIPWCIFLKLQMPRSCLYLHNSDPESERYLHLHCKESSDFHWFQPTIWASHSNAKFSIRTLCANNRIVPEHSQKTRNRKWLSRFEFFLIPSQRTVTLQKSGQSRITAFGRHERWQWLSKSTDFDESIHRRKRASLLNSHGHNYYESKHKWIFWCSQRIHWRWKINGCRHVGNVWCAVRTK